MLTLRLFISTNLFLKFHNDPLSAFATLVLLRIEPMYLVSEEYCHHALTRSATSVCSKQPPFRNIHPWKHSYQVTRLGKLMTFNSCINFKLSEFIGVFGYYIRGVIDCNEWKREKRHECTNMGKVKRLEL